MSDEMLHRDSEVQQEYAESFLEDTVPVTRRSEISEQFHQIKAIDEGGLPIEVVSIAPSVSYYPCFAYLTDRGEVRCGSFREDIENIDDEHFEEDYGSNVLYLGAKTIIDFEIYYETPFDQVYCGYLKDERRIGHSKFGSHDFGSGISLLSGLLTEVGSSTDLSTVDEIGQLSSIEASFIPDEDLTSGRIEVGGEKSEIHNCEKVDFVPSTSNADSCVRFVVGNNYGSFSSDEDFDVD